MKKWFSNQPVWKKYIIHFVCFFIFFLTLTILFDRIWPDEKSKTWKEYISRAFIFSFLFELIFNYLLFIPDYFKKKTNDESVA